MKESDQPGFAAAALHTTDVDAALAAADRITASPKQAEPVAPQQPVHRDRGNIAGWMIACLIIIMVVIIGIEGGSSNRPSTVGSDSSSSTYASGVPSIQGGTSVPPTTDAPTADAASTDQAATENAVDTTTSGDTGGMSVPSFGSTTLTMSELRYCVAEEVRISAQKAEMDQIQYLDTDKYNRNVDGFNEAVNDYNSRCSNRSFPAGERSTAEADVEQERGALEAEGRGRVN